jgi:hypothetical protein
MSIASRILDRALKGREVPEDQQPDSTVVKIAAMHENNTLTATEAIAGAYEAGRAAVNLRPAMEAILEVMAREYYAVHVTARYTETSVGGFVPASWVNLSEPIRRRYKDDLRPLAEAVAKFLGS